MVAFRWPTLPGGAASCWSRRRSGVDLNYKKSKPKGTEKISRKPVWGSEGEEGAVEGPGPLSMTNEPEVG